MVTSVIRDRLALIKNPPDPANYTPQQRFLLSDMTPGAICRELLSTYRDICGVPAEAELQHYPREFLVLARQVDVSMYRAAVTTLCRGDEDISPPAP